MALEPTRIVDYFGIEVGGAEVAGAACEEVLPDLLLGLLSAARALHEGRFKTVVHFREQPREMVLARSGDAIALSLLALGVRPELVLRDLPVSLDELLRSVVDEAGKLQQRMDELDPTARRRGWPRRFALARLDAERRLVRPPEAGERRRPTGPGAPLAARHERDGVGVRVCLVPDRWLRTYRRGDGRDLHGLLGDGHLEVETSTGPRVLSDVTRPPVLALMGLLQDLESLLRQGTADPRRDVEMGLRSHAELLRDLVPEEVAPLCIAAAHAATGLAHAVAWDHPHQGMNRALGELVAMAGTVSDLASARALPAAASPRPARDRGPEHGAEPDAPDAHVSHHLWLGRARRILMTPRWRHAPAPGSPPQPPLVHEDGVVVTDGDALVCLDAATGARRWQIDGARAPAAVAGTLLAHGTCGELLALAPDTGAPRWTRPARSAGGSAGPTEPPRASASPGRLLLDEGHGHLALVRHADGATLWERVLPGEVRRAIPLHLRGRFVVACDDGTLWGLDASTGETRFRLRAAGAFALPPLACQGRAVVATCEGDLPGGTVLCVDPVHGEVAWKRSFGLRIDRPLLLIRDRLIIVSRVEEFASVTAVEPMTGRTEWTREVEYIGVSGLARPLVVGDTVVVKSDDHRLLGLDFASGATRWELAMEAERCLDVLANVDPVAIGDIALMAADTVYALRAATGDALGRLDATAVPTSLHVVHAAPRAIVIVADEDHVLQACALGFLAVV